MRFSFATKVNIYLSFQVELWMNVIRNVKCECWKDSIRDTLVQELRLNPSSSCL